MSSELKHGSIPVNAWDHAIMRMNGELTSGRAKHGPMLSVMDGWARLQGEIEELRAEVYGRDEDADQRLFHEAVQVAAMAIRLAVTATNPKQVEP